jgi:hypothetical protein
MMFGQYAISRISVATRPIQAAVAHHRQAYMGIGEMWTSTQTALLRTKHNGARHSE